MATTRLMTIEDLIELEDTPGRYDLIRGELVRMPPAQTEHVDFAAAVVARLYLHAYENKAGRVYTAEPGFVLARDPDVLVAPDAAFVRRDRLPPPGQRSGFFRLVPDIVLEVVSPSDRQRDVSNKVGEYLDAGASLVWVVEPNRRQVVVYSSDRTARILTVDDYLDGGDVLPGFQMPVAEIFEG